MKHFLLYLVQISFFFLGSILYAQDERVVYCEDFDWISLRSLNPTTSIKNAYFKVVYHGDTLYRVEIKTNKWKLHNYKKRKKWKGEPILQYYTEYRGKPIYENTFFRQHRWCGAVYYCGTRYQLRMSDSLFYQIHFTSTWNGPSPSYNLSCIYNIKQKINKNKLYINSREDLYFDSDCNGELDAEEMRQYQDMKDSIKHMKLNNNKVEYLLSLILDNKISMCENQAYWLTNTFNGPTLTVEIGPESDPSHRTVIFKTDPLRKNYGYYELFFDTHHWF